MGAMSGSLDTCRKLVSAGAVIDARDNLGRLALIKPRFLFIYRAVDLGPDPINLSSWIRIRIRIQDDPQIQKKVKNFHVLKYWMFSFEG
jgi:hypothetical protein